MKKFTFLIVANIISASMIYAQKPHKVLTRVRYTSNNVLETMPIGKKRSEKMLLFNQEFRALQNAKDGEHQHVDNVNKKPCTKPEDFNPLDQ